MLWIEGAVVLFCILTLAIFGASFAKGGAFHENYLSLESTKPLRGLFAAVIVVHHLSGWYAQLSPMTLFSHIGYLIVALFFFLSGYGLYYSFTRKPDYLRGFLQNRLPGVLLPYYLITLIWAAGLCAVRDFKTPAEIVLSMLGIRIFVTGGWYACMLTILYILFFIAFRFGKQYRGVLFTALFIITAALLYLSDVDETWTRSLLAFPVGMLWCRYKPQIDGCIRKRYPLVLIGVTALFGIACAVRFAGVFLNRTLLTEIGSHLSSALVPVFFFTLTQKVSFRNRALLFLGEISNEVYLLHYLFLILLGKIPFLVSHVTLYVLCTFLCVIPVAWLVHKADTFLLTRLKKRIAKKCLLAV